MTHEELLKLQDELGLYKTNPHEELLARIKAWWIELKRKYCLGFYPCYKTGQFDCPCRHHPTIQAIKKELK